MADQNPQDLLKSTYVKLNNLERKDKGKEKEYAIDGESTTISSFIAKKTVEAIIGDEDTLTVTGLKAQLTQVINALKGDGWDGETVKNNADEISGLPRFTTRTAGNGTISFPKGAKMVQVYSEDGRLRLNVIVDVYDDRIVLSSGYESTDEVRIIY